MNEKISIILPIFNVGSHLKGGIDSLINQTIGNENLEIIMVDDCSTDESGKIIDEYSEKYENCKFVETVRRGENCELTIKTDDFSVTRQVGGVIKDLTGCPVTGVINTPATRILLQF